MASSTGSPTSTATTLDLLALPAMLVVYAAELVIQTQTTE